MADEMPEEVNAGFKDEKGRPWFPRLTLPLVDRFCRENNVKMGAFSELELNQAQLIDLVYLGTRYQALARAEPETREDFLAALDGPAYSAALWSARAAVANFSLRSLPLSGRRQRAAALLQKRETMLREAEAAIVDKALEVMEAAAGPASMSSGSAASPESTPAPS